LSPRAPPSFPTRRSSDLPEVRAGLAYVKMSKVDRIRGALGGHQSRTRTGRALVGFLHVAMNPQRYVGAPELFAFRRDRLNEILVDRKSTRLNSSHVAISY